jgi:hypothetical protein
LNTLLLLAVEAAALLIVALEAVLVVFWHLALL